PTPESAPNMAAPDAAAGGRAMWDQFGKFAVVTVLAVTMACLIAVTPFLALSWQHQPFVGAFLEQTLILNDTGFTAHEPWPAFAAGARPGDQLMAVDGTPGRTSQQVSAVLARKSPGQTAQLALARPGTADPITVSVGLNPFPAQAFITYFGLPDFVVL